MDRRSFMGMLAAAGAANTLPQPRARAADAPPKARNVVLVHGLFADGSCWSDVIPRLQAAGMNATSVQNPLTTLDEASPPRSEHSPDRAVQPCWSGTPSPA